MSKVDELIEILVAEAGIPKYAYNSRIFDPEKDTVYYSGPFWDNKEIEAGIKAFLLGRWIVSGENVARFQVRFSRKFGVRYSHMVNSGSSANLTMMSALKKFYDWKTNDEIIVSPVGFPTTIAPIVQNGMKPIFVDIEMNTLNFDLKLIPEKISSKTKAIVVSPVLGNPPNLDELRSICKENDLLLIGDNCDSLGTKWKGKLITDYYKVWSTSLYPAHHISTGEGGLISSNEKDLIDLARSISWWGRDCRCVGEANLLPCGTCGKRFDKWLPDYDGVIDHKYYFTNMGYNLKPLDMQGAIGIEQLDKFEIIDVRRRENFARISALIRRYVKEVKIAEKFTEADPAWFGVPIICSSSHIKESFQQFLESHRIQTRNYFAGNILLHPGYAYLDKAVRYKNANKALSHVFFVGCAPHYGPEIFKYYERVLKQWKI